MELVQWVKYQPFFCLNTFIPNSTDNIFYAIHLLGPLQEEGVILDFFTVRIGSTGTSETEDIQNLMCNINWGFFMNFS